MRKIVIEVSGGIVQEIYSTEKENDAVAIYVIDWDNINAGQLNLLEEYPIEYLTKKEIGKIIDSANLEIEKNPERI